MVQGFYGTVIAKDNPRKPKQGGMGGSEEMLGMIDAVRGCLKEEIRMDVIANNLANASVAGFKRDRISFQDLLLQQGSVSAEGAGTPGGGKTLVRVQPDFSQGDIYNTGNMLDFAISGKGFFKVATPYGIRYTRKGNFKLNALGNLITQDGYVVLGKGGPINLFDTQDLNKHVTVDERGVITFGGDELDQLDIVSFANDDALVKVGNGLFKKRQGANEDVLPPETKVRQRCLESSNVNVAEEMVQMIHSLRAFESYQKAIKVLDRLDNKATNEVSRLK